MRKYRMGRCGLSRRRSILSAHLAARRAKLEDRLVSSLQFSLLLSGNKGWCEYENKKA